MTWGSASAFFAMGGYGLYVWGSFGLIALCMAVDALTAIKRHRDACAVPTAEPGENS